MSIVLTVVGNNSDISIPFLNKGNMYIVLSVTFAVFLSSLFVMFYNRDVNLLCGRLEKEINKKP
jgi:hypothetical protein